MKKQVENALKRHVDTLVEQGELIRVDLPGSNKKETVAEFLARGGKITRVPTPTPTTKVETIKSTKGGGPATIVTMDEADLYHGESKKKKAKKKVLNTIDISALPEALRKKYIDGVIHAKENNEEDDE